MNDTPQSQARRSAFTLLAFAVVCTALLGATYALTSDRVAANEAAARRALIGQTLPAGSFDNDLIAEAHPLSAEDAEALGRDDGARVYVARLAGQTTGYVFEAAARNGYGGRIELLVGLSTDGAISGVRVVSHKETPGLGDYIDSGKSAWPGQFLGRRDDSDKAWKVKKDGGRFDAPAGATVSARAVTGAVGRVARYWRDHQTQLKTLP
ncbi:electron transport complex subunit RsxG [Crenobacter cavernae]|uniref:Ion-translocating oxidoreductase complex subunit G n=1 Tax=Crenobacter cavernae TaxID=2290923 RepID=A0A345Y995_9NEIS|nr:electron transport complex subunit RsxG [Crenobacter cavernae]AXK40497.1 electron transport complex subunit RsxG [Crenobacter cavernae]